MTTQLKHPHTDAVGQFRPLAALIPNAWERGSVTSATGTALSYLRTGSGDGHKPALVLLHGVQVSGIMWLRTALALAETYDVIMPDARGHGHTGGLDQPLTAELLAEDVLVLMQALSLRQPFVVGHSMGADTAGHVAARADLRGVVLVDPALQNMLAMLPPDGEIPAFMQPILQTMAALRDLPHPARMTAGLGLLMPGAPLWAEADYVAYVEGSAQFDAAFYRDFRRVGYLFEHPEIIARIACPILLLTARPMMPGPARETGLAAFTDHWQQGRHIAFEDSGHFIPFDQHARFIAVLREFFESL